MESRKGFIGNFRGSNKRKQSLKPTEQKKRNLLYLPQCDTLRVSQIKIVNQFSIKLVLNLSQVPRNTKVSAVLYTNENKKQDRLLVISAKEVTLTEAWIKYT